MVLGFEANDERLHGPIIMEVPQTFKSKRSSFACTRCNSLNQARVPSNIADVYREPC